MPKAAPNPRRVHLYSQAMTALGAASVDHLAATLGSHANQKTVGTLAANDRRLIRAFHDLFLKQTNAANSRLDSLSTCLSRQNANFYLIILWINLGGNCRIFLPEHTPQAITKGKPGSPQILTGMTQTSHPGVYPSTGISHPPVLSIQADTRKHLKKS